MRADVVLLDGSNVAHRVWHAAGADPFKASVTLTAMVRAAVTRHAPAFVAVAFDDATCFRTRLCPDYKKGRLEKSEALLDWLGSLRGLDRIAGVRVLVSPEREADDVLATLVVQARKMSVRGEPLEVLLVTHDSDAYALVGPTVTVGLAGTLGGITYVGPTEVIAKLGVLPRHVLAYKSLAGDASDGVPGVPGVGPVRARALLSGVNEERGKQALLAALDALAAQKIPPLAKTIENARACALASYRLVRPDPYAPLRWHLRDCGLWSTL